MKKSIVLLLVVLSTAVSAMGQLNIHYKGYAELSDGVLIPAGDAGREVGVSVGLSTSHGVQLFNSLFVGGGIEVTGEQYYDDFKCIGVGFFDARYNFRKGQKIQPFVGARIGGGYQSLSELSCFYFSPSSGVSFNIREKFGLDATLAYKLYRSVDTDTYFYESKYNYLYNGITLSVGIHF